MKELLEKLITVYNKTHKGQLFIKNDILFSCEYCRIRLSLRLF